MSTAYKVKEDGENIQIVRSKDDKVMANVIDGELLTTAAAYNRASILGELKKTHEDWIVGQDEVEEDEVEETPQTVAGIDAEDLIDVIPAPEVEEVEEVEVEEDDELTQNIKTIIEAEGVEGVARYVAQLLGEKEESKKGIDFSQAPACVPALGDRTPEFMEWLKDNHPTEAIKRYGSL